MSIYTIPSQFAERLVEEFGDKLRVRWSDKWDEWHVEQKVRRGLAGQPLADADRYHDDVIRYKDGYVWIMSFKQGSKFPCPKCHLTLTAPTRQTEMISCTHCRLKGYEHRWVASHWPMDETLIDHLKMLEHGVDHRGPDIKKQNAILQKQMERSVLDPTLDGFQDQFNKLAGIQSVGYTGKVFTG